MMPLIFFYIFIICLLFAVKGPAFTDIFTENWTSLERSSPPINSVHQDDAVTSAVFVLVTLTLFATSLC